MRMGRLQFSIDYVVDLDNKDMVRHAIQAMVDDLNELVRYELEEYINEVEDDTLSVDDIHEFLTELDEEED
jgi:hypothetical protein